MFRLLNADEIECRVAKVLAKGIMLLLYKDARCDMRILDETLTPFGWKREHKELKNVIYCGVSIKDNEGEWITKWDAGAESFAEKEKGEASDSFKRACVNWGIGRELYTAPFIWVDAKYVNLIEDGKDKYGNVKYKTYDTFYVEGISYNDCNAINGISIKNSKTNTRVFRIDPPKEQGEK